MLHFLPWYRIASDQGVHFKEFKKCGNGFMLMEVSGFTKYNTTLKQLPNGTVGWPPEDSLRHHPERMAFSLQDAVST